MQINSINLSNNILKDTDLSKLQIGQRFQVEVIRNDKNQEGLISLNGKILKAKFAAEVQTGDKFMAAVKEADENGIILSREILSNPRINNLNTSDIILLINRGIGFDSEAANYLNQFVSKNPIAAFLSIIVSDKSRFNNLKSLFWKIIPRWAELDGLNSKILLQYYKNLGIEYEKNIFENIMQSKNDIVSDDNVPIKMELMKIASQLNDSISKEERALLDELLAEITGQQLWIQTGTKKNAYCLLHFPLLDNGHLYNCKIGIEGARKGKRIDIAHCHIALEVETENLGLVGADIGIYENNIHIEILNDNTGYLNPIIEKFYSEAVDRFAQLGLNLKHMSIKTYNDSPHFTSFISGKFFGGVDIKG